MKRISILGSTGSIGTQALDVIAHHSDRFHATVLLANGNDQLLEQQIEQFKPEVAVLLNEERADILRKRYTGTTKILSGSEGLLQAATHQDVDMVLTAMVGAAGIQPTLAAIDAGKDIALANKETLVAAGSLVMERAKKKKVKILPVDSEHSALFQCLSGEKKSQIKKLLITASGGPFRDYTRAQLEQVSVEACLKHPNWSMGRKITVDSATLINKGLEVIEAHWLYQIPFDNIQVVVHPQSIIHSMVEFVDGCTMAQLGLPDMRLPIQYAFSWPERLASPVSAVDWTALRELTFSNPDLDTFSGLAMAYQAGKMGGTMPAVLNAANEEAVTALLNQKITFLQIYACIAAAMENHTFILSPTLDQILAADIEARSFVKQYLTR